MSLTTQVSDALKMCRTAVDGATVTMRYLDREYSGIGGTLEQERYTDPNGDTWETMGYVRLIVSELPDRLPKSGDQVQVLGADGKEWITRILTIVRKDETGAGIRCEYGERHD